ncbi:MAG: heavy-metal-associated domain-containing protein, partial [Alphaproteobacteria bacterium]|nr:heavy-metal-associated domain-containing protein [Alphaproteobacteria bacterium]
MTFPRGNRLSSGETNEDTTMLEVKVTGMTCQGCVRAVTKAIGRVA